MKPKMFRYSEWIEFYKTLEAFTPIEKGDARVDIVDDFIQCIGYPGQGTHAASDWASRNAWDLKAPVGSNVYSISDGQVVRVRKSSGGLKRIGVKKIFGDQLSIKSTDGKPDVFYTHITTDLQVGDVVKTGDVVGQIIYLAGIPAHLHIGLSNGNLLDYIGNVTKGGVRVRPTEPPVELEEKPKADATAVAATHPKLTPQEPIQTVDIKKPKSIDLQYSQIFIPQEVTNKLPLLAFYPMKNNENIIKDLLTGYYTDWTQKFGMVFPSNYDQPWSDVEDELIETLQDEDLELNYLTIGLFGESTRKEILDDILGIEKVDTLFIMNPQPTKDFIKFLDDTKTNTQIFIGLSPSLIRSKYPETNVTEFLNSIKKFYQTRNLNINDFYKEFDNIENVDLPKETIDKFKQEFESKVAGFI